jgi:Bacterial Ig-like domain (group 3)
MFPTLISKLRATLTRASALFILAAATCVSAQTTLNVGPGQPYITIQSGINAATAGDTVLVAPGTYYENIDFKGKAITVTSSGGASVTTIDGGNTGGVATVLFSGGETSSSIISGFTIRGGGDDISSGTSFGGIYVSGTMNLVAGPSPTIQNNIITANYCHAIGVQDGTPTILNNEISGTLQNTQGSGTQASYCGPNDAIYLGGTPNFANGNPVVIGNTIENNSADGSAIHVNSAAKVLVMNNVIRNNYSRSTGSAFMSENTDDSVVVQNLIYGNTSTCGGALSFNGGILIANNTIVDNVYVDLFSGSECTAIAQIYPDNYSYGFSNPNRVIINNIISGSTSYPAVNCDSLDPPSLSIQPTFEYNLLRNTGGPFFGSYCVDVTAQDNNVTADPQFVNAAANNYHLKSTSPAVDAGDNGVLETFMAMTGLAFTKDFDGNPRVQDATHKGTPIIDMGAYEYAGVLDGNSVTETLTSSLNPSTSGTNVTFSAVLSSTSGTPTGSVQFKDGGTVLGVQTVSATGTSSYSTSGLAVGTHPITAVYEPTGTFTASTSNFSQVVSGDTSTTTTTTLTCNPAALSVNTTSLFSATVSSTSGTPTGSILFTDDGTTLSQPTLTNGAASYTLTARQSGTRTIVATYVPTGSFEASSASCVLTVSGFATKAALSVAPTLASQGSPITLTASVSGGPPGFRGSPVGSITFYNGSTVIDAGAHLLEGTVSFTTTTLPPGIDYLTCTYSGNTTFAPSTCNTVPVIITQTSSVITLASSLNPALALTPITFTAQIAPGSSGTIVFNVDGQNITTTPNAAGTSTYTTSSLTRGSYLITASYFATPNSLTGQASLIQDVNLPVTPPDFSLTGTDITVQINHAVTGKLLLASVGSFAGSVALTCNPPYPPGYTCKLQTSNVSLPNGFSTYVTYTLSPTYSTSNQPIAHSTRFALAALFPLSFFGLMGLARKRRTTVRTFLCLVVLTTLASITTACGPDHFIPLIRGAYPITFTGVGTGPNIPAPITHTVTINATIAP